MCAISQIAPATSDVGAGEDPLEAWRRRQRRATHEPQSGEGAGQEQWGQVRERRLYSKPEFLFIVVRGAVAVRIGRTVPGQRLQSLGILWRLHFRTSMSQ